MELDLSNEDIEPSLAGALWTGPRHDPNRYQVDLDEGTLQSVGDGGEGLVFRATSVIDGDKHYVALKMHTAARMDDYTRLVTRAGILSGVNHPNVMHLLDAFVGTALVEKPPTDDEDFNVIYTVADWIPGVPFHEAVEAAGPVAGLLWVAEIARAAAYLHDYRSDEAPAGILHRDIKPSNVRVTDEHNAVLIDFGIARPHEDGDLTEGAGTYLWRAPEVLGGPGNPGPSSDAWGIGALAYWVVVGEPPRLEGAQTARGHLTVAAREAGLRDSESLGRHIAQLLENHPDQRPTDLAVWADEMAAIVVGSRRKRRWQRPKVLIPTLSSLCAIALVVALISTGTFSHSSPVLASLSGPSYRLPTFHYNDGVTVSQIWTYVRSTRNSLEGTVTVTNTRHSTVRHSYDEVIPKTLAKSVDTISFSSKYDSVVNPDPIVRYCLRLAPRARRILTYAVPLGAAPTARQYDEWAQTWEIGTTDVLAHTKGALCRGTSKKQPKATIDTKGAGLIPPSGQGESATGKQAFVPGGSGFHGSTSSVAGNTPVIKSGSSSGPSSGSSSGPSSGSSSPTHTLAWSAPTEFDSPAANEVVSCASSRFCAAVNDTNTIFMWGGTWADNPAYVGDQFKSVSCTSNTFCVAVGNDGNGYGDISMFDGISWSDTNQLIPGSFNSVACTSPTFCMAVGGQPSSVNLGVDLAARYNGATWSVVPTPSIPDQPPGGSTSLLSVSCSSPSSCSAQGDYILNPETASHSEDYNGTTWTISQEPVPTGGKGGPPFNGVSCAGSEFCLAVGYQLAFATDGSGQVSQAGDAKSYNGNSWSAVQIPGSVPLSGISCMTTGECFVGTFGTGSILTYRVGSWSPGQRVDGTNSIASISCPTSAFCMALDTAGNFLTYS